MNFQTLDGELGFGFSLEELVIFVLASSPPLNVSFQQTSHQENDPYVWVLQVVGMLLPSSVTPKLFLFIPAKPSPQSKHPELVNEEKEENRNTSDYGYFSVMAVFHSEI